jgi:hypothetical protein
METFFVFSRAELCQSFLRERQGWLWSANQYGTNAALKMFSKAGGCLELLILHLSVHIILNRMFGLFADCIHKNKTCVLRLMQMDQTCGFVDGCSWPVWAVRGS